MLNESELLPRRSSSAAGDRAANATIAGSVPEFLAARTRMPFPAGAVHDRRNPVGKLDALAPAQAPGPSQHVDRFLVGSAKATPCRSFC